MGKLKKIGPYRVTRTMGSTVSAVLATASGCTRQAPTPFVRVRAEAPR